MSKEATDFLFFRIIGNNIPLPLMLCASTLDRLLPIKKMAFFSELLSEKEPFFISKQAVFGYLYIHGNHLYIKKAPAAVVVDWLFSQHGSQTIQYRQTACR